MKYVLNITKNDSIGRRFNNIDARDNLIKYGWNSLFCSWTENNFSNDFSTSAIGKINRKTTTALSIIERITGNINGYFYNSESIINTDFYKKAELLHYHIVHERFLSNKDWLRISNKKPVVWTWHDPFLLTGHCVYPMDCEGYKHSCESCNHLNYHFEILRDRSGKNLKEKIAIIRQINPRVIVASNFMKKMIEQTEYAEFLRYDVLPFGIALSKKLSQSQAKEYLGIPSKNIVIGFRAVDSVYKGMDLIKHALLNITKTMQGLPVTIIAFQDKNKFPSIYDKLHVIDAGWVKDDDIYLYYSALDFFLMPSKAEAFGMMAIEAMISGAVPIVTHGTALSEVVGGDEFGIISSHTMDDYTTAVKRAIQKKDFYDSSRNKRQEFALQEYNLEKFSQKLSEIYQNELEYYLDHRRSS